MSAGIHNLKFTRGETNKKKFIWKVDGVPVPLLNWSVLMTVKKDRASAPYISPSTANGLITVSNEGAILLTLSETLISAFPFATGIYDLKMTSPEQEVTRLLEGKVYISRGLTG